MKILITVFLGLLPLVSWTATDLKSQVFDKQNFNADSKNRKGFRTDAVLVVKSGQTIFEKYGRGHTPTTRHITWSVSKTVMSLLYGVAINDGLIKLDDSICKIAPLPRKEYCDIKYEHLLSFSSGIKWTEDYERSKKPLKSSVLAMLYGEGRKDMAGFVALHPLEHKPGEVWRYSSGDSVLAAERLSQIYKTLDLNMVFQQKLFKPLGILNAIFETDLKGTPVAASYFYATASDLVKIGELIMNKGLVGKKELIEKKWFDWSLKVSPAFINKNVDHDQLNVPGAHIWLNTSGVLPGGKKPVQELPEDSVFLLGHWGQYVVVIPSLDVVAVRLGDTRDGSYRLPAFGKSLAEFLSGEFQ